MERIRFFIPASAEMASATTMRSASAIAPDAPMTCSSSAEVGMFERSLEGPAVCRHTSNVPPSRVQEIHRFADVTRARSSRLAKDISDSHSAMVFMRRTSFGFCFASAASSFVRTGAGFLQAT